MIRHSTALLGALVIGGLGLAGCNSTTSKLSAAAEQQFVSEGITRRGDDLNFRYTHDAGSRESGWEDRRASIIVTRQSLLIHKNDKVGLEINPRTRRHVDVARVGGRIRIHAGSGRSQEVWSFEPPSDAPGWTDDIRAVAKSSQSTANKQN